MTAMYWQKDNPKVRVLDDFRRNAVDEAHDARRRKDINVLEVARGIREGITPPVAGGAR